MGLLPSMCHLTQSMYRCYACASCHLSAVAGCKVLSAHWHKVVWDAGTLIQQIIQDFADHSSSDCRQQYFEILRSAWQLRPAMHAVLRPALLVMLGDPDSQLRAEALSFWDSALPKAVGPRLQALLQDSLAEPAHLVSLPLHLPLALFAASLSFTSSSSSFSLLLSLVNSSCFSSIDF